MLPEGGAIEAGAEFGSFLHRPSPFFSPLFTCGKLSTLLILSIMLFCNSSFCSYSAKKLKSLRSVNRIKKKRLIETVPSKSEFLSVTFVALRECSSALEKQAPFDPFHLKHIQAAS